MAIAAVLKVWRLLVLKMRRKTVRGEGGGTVRESLVVISSYDYQISSR